MMKQLIEYIEEGLLAGMDKTIAVGDDFVKKLKAAEKDFKRFKKDATHLVNYSCFNGGRAYQFKMPMSRLFKALGFDKGTHFAVYIMTTFPNPKVAEWYCLADVYMGTDHPTRIPVGSYKTDVADSPREAIDKVLMPIVLKDYETFISYLKEEYFKTYQPEIYKQI